MEGKGKGKGKGKEKVDTSQATEASSQNDSASSAMVSHVCTTSFGDETPSSRSRRPHSQPVLPSRSLRLNGPNPTPLKWQKKCWNETCASGICLHCRRHQPVPLGVAWRGLPRCGFRAQPAWMGPCPNNTTAPGRVFCSSFTSSPNIVETVKKFRYIRLFSSSASRLALQSQRGAGRPHRSTAQVRPESIRCQPMPCMPRAALAFTPTNLSQPA